SKSTTDRINNLDKTLFGEKGDGSIAERAEKIANYVLAEGSTPSISFIMNSLEWSLADEMYEGDIAERLESLEKNVFGKKRTGALIPRIERLTDMSFSEGRIDGEKVELESNQEIPLKLIEDFDSSKVQKGQIIEFEIAKDITIDNKLVFPEGKNGKMRVREVQSPGQFGKDGKIKVEFLDLTAIDGTKVNFKRPDEESMEQRSRQLAVGAGFLGAIVFNSPLGAAVSYFVPGNHEVYERGSKISVLVEGNYEIFALGSN
ncbi:MAG: hypothetical protein ACOCRX_04250, partial [Candidatus Woesearchaeota archaeon]